VKSLSRRSCVVRVKPTVTLATSLVAVAAIGLGLVAASSAQTPLTGYAAAVIDDNPAGYWRLGEAAGNFADSSPSETHPGAISLVGSSDGSLFLRAQPGGIVGDDGAVRDDAAPSGFGESPNGASVFVNRDGSCTTDPTFEFRDRTPFSLEIWVRPGSHGSTFKGGIIGNYNMDGSGSYNIGYGLYLSWPARTLTFERHDASSQGLDSISTSVPADEWRHAVATYDGTTMALYVNGTLAGQTTSTRDLPGAACVVRIGAFVFDFGFTDYPGYFYGSLDEGAVYSRALTAEEIAAHFQAGSEPLLLTLTSDPSDIALGSYRAVSATFSGGTVPAGTAVDFTITGANPTTGRAFTDAEGRAEFVYGAAVEGSDEIRALASVAGTSVEATPLTVSARVPLVPDPFTESRYVIELRESRFRFFGTFAGNSGAFGPVVLSFGQPNAGGTKLVSGSVRSYDRIVRMLQVFSNAYHTARLQEGRGKILIVVGVSNDMPEEWNDNLALASEAGADFARAVKRYQTWVAGTHHDRFAEPVSYTTQRVAAGIDIEEAWDPANRETWSRYDVTKAFLEGYNDVAGHPKLLNYGALTIDPNCDRGTATDGRCVVSDGRGWSAERVLEMSRPPYSTFICPQVYTEFQIDNWIALQRAAKSGRLDPPPMSMYVKCLFNSEPSPPNFTVRQSWNRFWTQLAPDLRGNWTEQHATHTKAQGAS